MHPTRPLLALVTTASLACAPAISPASHTQATPRVDSGALDAGDGAADGGDGQDGSDGQDGGDGQDGSDGEDPPPVPRVRINELMPRNRDSNPGPEGLFLDWVELINLHTEAVDLAGWSLTDDWQLPDQMPLPSVVLEPGERVVFWMDAEARTDEALPHGLAREGAALRLFDPYAQESDLAAYSDSDWDEAWARIPDGEGTLERMPVGTRGLPNARIVLGTQALVEAGASWSYRDGGVEPGEGWTAVDFDDSGWPQGAAPLGYGDEQATLIDSGSTSEGRALTAWFRHSFTVEAGPSAAVDALLGLRSDDGARVWLDGEELVREGLPAGEVGPNTAANRTVSGDGELAYTEHTIDVSLLAPGPHVLAVDLHQANRSSSDMTLDLWLHQRVYTTE